MFAAIKIYYGIRKFIPCFACDYNISLLVSQKPYFDRFFINFFKKIGSVIDNKITKTYNIYEF